MNTRELASFVIKMLGIYSFIHSLPLTQSVFYLFYKIADRNDGASLSRILLQVASIAPFLLSLVLGIILITCSDRISRIVIRQKSDLPEFNSISSKRFQAICFSTVGVFVFILALPGLFHAIHAILFMRNQYTDGHLVEQRIADRALNSSIATAIQLIFAIILFFGSTGLANFWHRLQIAKYQKIEETKEN